MPGRSGRDEKQFGAPVGYEPPSSATDRPKVGPADPDTQRRAMAKQDADAKRENAAGLYQTKPSTTPSATPSKPHSASDPENPTRDLSVLGAVDKIQGRKAQIDQAVENAGG